MAIIDHPPKAEIPNIPSDLVEYISLIQDIADAAAQSDSVSLRAAQERYGTRLRSERDRWLSPRTRAILQYCVHDPANRDPTNNEIEVKHNPIEVLERLAEFEAMLKDPRQSVLLTGCPILKTIDTFLSGDVEYREGDYNFWEVWVNNTSKIHLAVICEPIYDRDGVARAVQRGQSMENVLIVGEDARRAYAASVKA